MALTHGHTRGYRQSPTYMSWRGMTKRCECPTDPFFHRYGGQGVKVCRRWRSFENFLLDMGVRPKGLTLERLDNLRGYSKSNCVWADQKTQQRHRADTKLSYAIVAKIRASTESSTTLAARYGVQSRQINRVRQGTRWA